MSSNQPVKPKIGLSQQGRGLSQQYEYETIIFDSFLDAKGGNGKGGPGGGGSGGNELALTDSYVTGYNDSVADNEEFNIRINFYGDSWSDALKDDFTNSADFLSALITNDIAPGGYDDITISASLISIDGSGGVLGRAGPTAYWVANTLSSAAIMEFDVADANNFDALNLWDDIVLHEMLHSIGFGTLWEYQGLVETIIDDNGTKKPVDDIVSSVFTGDTASAYSDLLFGDPQPLVETDGGSGTAGGHWDEEAYVNELMTGYIDNPNYLSDMTYGALEDMGYSIDFTISPSDFFLV